MTRTRPPQYSMSSGEVSPLLYSRPDYQRNQTGLRRCNGFLPLRQGGATRAPGTLYRGTTKDNQKARLVEFQFAANDTVTLEFTNECMRVWRYGELVFSGASVFELETPFQEADLPRLQWVQSADVIYLVDGQRPIQKLSRFALDDWSIEPLELNSGPFRIQNLDETKTIQCSGVFGAVGIWTENETLEVGNLRRHGTRTYRFKGYSLAKTDGEVGPNPPVHEAGEVSYEWTGPPPDDLEMIVYWEYLYTSQSTGSITLTSNANLFTAEHVGTLFRIEPTDYKNIPLWVGEASITVGDLIAYDGRIYEITVGTNTGVNPPLHDHGERRTDASRDTVYRYVSDLVGIVRITAVTDGNEATADVLREIPQPAIDDATYRWSEGAWSEIYGYPAALEIFEQRLWAARTPSEPRTIWASSIGIFDDFDISGEADGAIAYSVAGSQTSNEILWMKSARNGIYIGALGEAYRGFSTDQNQAIGPTTFDTELVADEGVSSARPISMFGYPIYITRDGSKMQELRYSFEQDGARPLELSLPSEHLGEYSFLEVAWQSAPQRYIWTRLGNGSLCATLYDPEEQILGWAEVSVAGGIVEAISVSPSADGKKDILTLVVLRVLNGETVRHVEEMSLSIGTGGQAILASKMVHFFSSVTIIPEEKTDSFTALHLRGEEVLVWTETGTLGPYLVGPIGEVVTEYPVERATIGLFDADHHFELLDIPAAAQDGSTIGRKKRLCAGSGVILHQTAGGVVRGVERSFAQPVEVRAPERLIARGILANVDNAVTGNKKIEVTTGHADEISLRFEPDGGAPMTVLAVIPNIEEAGA